MHEQDKSISYAYQSLIASTSQKLCNYIALKDINKTSIRFNFTKTIQISISGDRKIGINIIPQQPLMKTT